MQTRAIEASFFSESDQVRFWSCVNKRGPDDCWLWTGSLDKRGYGQFSHNKTLRKTHRVSYALMHGCVPVGGPQDRVWVCHSCDVPACVNPAHLWLGTNAENLQDMENKGRFPRGEQRSHAKITSEIAISIMERLLNGERGTDLAAEFGISKGAICDLKNGRTWKHISTTHPLWQTNR